MTFVVGEHVKQTLQLLLQLGQHLPCFSVCRLKVRLDHVAPAAIFNLGFQLQQHSGSHPALVVVEVQVQPLPKYSTVHTVFDLERANSADT